MESCVQQKVSSAELNFGIRDDAFAFIPVTEASLRRDQDIAHFTVELLKYSSKTLTCCFHIFFSSRLRMVLLRHIR